MYQNKNVIYNEKILFNSKRAKSAKNILNKNKELQLRKTPQITKEEQENLFNSLYNDSQIRKEKLRKMSQEKEDKFNSIYTFTPNIIPNKKNEKYLRKLNRSYSKNDINSQNNSFIDRLTNYEKVKNKNLKKIKAEIEESIPHPKQIKINYKDIKLITNSKQYLNEKNKKLEKLKENIYIEKGITFRPKLNEEINSKIQTDLMERNQNFLKEKEIKLHSIKEDSECTFTPKINENSTINQSTIISDVGERLYDYKNKYEKNLEEKKSKYKESYSFKPEISKNTNEILENRQKILNDIKSRYIINSDYNNNGNVLLKINEKRLEQLEESVKKINELTDENIISMQNFNEMNTINSFTNNDSQKKITEISNNNNIQSSENILDDKVFDSPQNFSSIDNTFDRLQMKYKSKFNNGRNEIDDKNKFINGMSNDDKEKQTCYSTTSSKTKSIVNLNYYENLI